MSPWYYRSSYTSKPPKSVKGGIKAQTKRGDFGKSWWAKRWIAALEAFNFGPRLGRGRSYARRGQVVSIDIAKGSVTAAVQGTRAKPYQVAIAIKTLARNDWTQILDALSKQMIFAAKLLAGEMPDTIEEVFKERKISLFPQRLSDLKTSCSCPDWANPCKHIAAVYYLMGEEFDRDPFLIFKLRGMDRDELVRGLGGVNGNRVSNKKRLETSIEASESDSNQREEPLPENPDLFWRPSPQDHVEGPPSVSIPRLPAALVKRLGAFPFWRGQEPFMDCLEGVYSKASPLGLEIYLRTTD